MKTLNVRKILIPLDFSETALLALEHGAYMASLFKAEVLLLYVIKPNLSMDGTQTLLMPIDIMKYMQENPSKKLKELAEKIRHKYGIKVERSYKTGFVGSTIVSAGEKYKADLIIMGTHDISGFTERFIGSNAYRVINESKCPVITVQAHSTKKGFKDILLPIDNSCYSIQKVYHAIELAERYGSVIHILGLSHSEDKAELTKLKAKLDQIEDFIDKHKLGCDRHLNIGADYAKFIMAYAEQVEADLIITMTEWEEDITGLFMGSFTKQIINHSKIPVMSIRPEVKAELVESEILWKRVSEF